MPLVSHHQHELERENSVAARTGGNITNPVFVDGFIRPEFDTDARLSGPGLDVVRLSSEQLFAVCSPKLLRGVHRLSKPADVLKFPLLYLDDRKAWSKWLEAAGVEAELPQGPVLNRASLVIDAAVDGQGIALARTTLAAWDLLSGRLVRPFAETLRLSKTYWIICPKATSQLPKITTFRDWLLVEAAHDTRHLQKLGAKTKGATRRTA